MFARGTAKTHVFVCFAPGTTETSVFICFCAGNHKKTCLLLLLHRSLRKHLLSLGFCTGRHKNTCVPQLVALRTAKTHVLLKFLHRALQKHVFLKLLHHAPQKNNVFLRFLHPAPKNNIVFLLLFSLGTAKTFVFFWCLHRGPQRYKFFKVLAPDRHRAPREPPRGPGKAVRIRKAKVGTPQASLFGE